MEDNKLRKDESEEETDEEKLIPSNPRLSLDVNESLSAHKGKIAIIISCFLVIVISLAIGLVFIFRPNDTYTKENLIILKYEIKTINRTIPIINKNFLSSISTITIQNSDKSMDKSIEPVDSYYFTEKDNYTIYIKFNESLTNLNNIFQDCNSLKEADLSQLNTSYVTQMEYTFDRCSALKQINFGDFNTSLVTSMKNMFSFCSSLTEINIKNTNTFNLEDISGMFIGCSSLKEIKIQNFNTQKIKYMNSTYESCNSLESLDLNDFNTPELTDISGMFKNCYKLKKLNICSKIVTD